MNDFTGYSDRFKGIIERELESSLRLIADSPLRESIAYVFSMGGKRVRPLITVFAAEAVGRVTDDVLHGAAAIEILHNFTLVHDDIMDNADTRRGKRTVHVESGTNTAILVGDLMMALAYDRLQKCRPEYLGGAMKIFNEGVKQVCDGQALDESLSKSGEASMEEYLDMISKKTGALLTAAGELGALLGGGTRKQVDLLGAFGLNIGIAFQILDDLLDLEGDVERFGKPIGLDIVEKKKNFLFLKAREVLHGAAMVTIDAAYSKDGATDDDVNAVKEIYRTEGIFDEARREVGKYTGLAVAALRTLNESDGKDALVELANALVQRRF